MKLSPLLKLSAAIVVVLSVFSCTLENAENTSTPGEPRIVAPSKDPVIVTPSGGGAAVNDFMYHASDVPDEEDTKPKIDLPKDSAIIQVVNANLDIDREDEQIIAFRKNDSPAAEIRIIVADYDSIQDTYFPAWNTGVEITNAMSFSLSFTDIVGDHTPEIICTGTDAETGNQLLRVYRKSLNPSGFGLYFTSIISLSVRGSIQIQEVDRDQAYYSGQKNGKSFPIVTLEPNDSSENLSDQIKTTYYWRYQENAYAQVLTEEVEGEKIDDERLDRLFRSGVREFESFLQGPWLKTDRASSGKVEHTVFYFDGNNRYFAVFSGDVQEEYILQNSTRTNYNQVYMLGANDLIRYIRKQLAVTVQDLDTISIWSNDGNDSWAGQYQRLKDDAQSLFSPHGGRNRADPVSVSGVFRNEAGESIVFNNPRFVYRSEDGERQGGYALYISGEGFRQNLVLELMFLTEGGLVDERKVYKADYLEEQRENEIIRTLVLIPGKLGIRGFVPSEEGFVQYEQIETVDDTSEE